MGKVKSFIKNKWLLQGLGLSTLAVIIWFVGPLVAIAGTYILESTASRLLVILVVLFIWSANQVRIYVKAKNNNDNLIDEMGSDAGDDSVSTAEETAVIQERFKDAVATLKSSSKDKKSKTLLYELPWYIIIGPPGSGKTTALLNSGLDFPLEDKIGMEAVKGIGGTRHCDWWFTSDAVLIDTAGRFTTQDSHASVDKAAWVSFMDMLKKYRKQRPINGALIAVSVSDLMMLSDEERSYYAKTIRKRLEELSEYLKINFPVYFMFTKCDLISGFNEFFAALDEEQRAQVWGHTFEFKTKEKSEFDADVFSASFESLVGVLKQQIVPKINAERDPVKKANIISFPSQVASLQQPLIQFLNDVFSSNHFKEGSLLRGVYFTSGTQEGTPFDRLLGNMAQSMGVSRDEGILYSGRGRSYFIKKLLSDVVFPESDLAGVDQKLSRLLRRLQIASLMLAVGVFAGFSAIWAISYGENSERISKVDENLVLLDKVAYKKPTLQGANFRAVLDELDLVLETTKTFDNKTFPDNFGLDQESTYRLQLDSLYNDALTSKFLPVLTGRLEELIRKAIIENDSALLYELLKAYLMYSGVNEKSDVAIEPEWLQQLMLTDWQSTFIAEPPFVERLQKHHKNLLSINFAPYKGDKSLIASARNTLMRLPIAEQVYLNVKQNLLADHSSDLLFRDMAGNFGAEVFKLRSGKDLNSFYIPGLFTKKGFYQEFLLQSSSKSDDYLNNNWVLGEHNSRGSTIDKSSLQKDLYQYYYSDYIGIWGQLLRNLTFVEPDNTQHGMTILEQSSGINGPLETLIYTIVKETDLSSPLSDGIDGQAATEALGVVSGTAQRVASTANQLSRRAEKAGLQNQLGVPVTRHFEKYHRLVSSNRGDPAINRLLRDAQNFALFINQTLFDGFGDSAAFEAVNNRLTSQGRDPFSALKASRAIMPEEVRDWIDVLSDIGWTMLLDESKSDLSKVWQSEVLDFYHTAIEGKYPLKSNSAQELELRDFAEFFRPDGILDGFLNSYIKPFVNLRAARWTEKNIDGQKLSFSPGVLNQLEIASQVTELFFQRGSLEPRIQFTMTPVSLSGRVSKINFSAGNQSFVYEHGPLIPNKLTWPLEQGRDSVRLTFTSVDGVDSSQSQTGPWSLFKMLDNQTLIPTQQKSIYFVNFSDSVHQARFELRADTEFNPLGERILQNLNLPKEL